jgi:hypothetical protein
MVRYRTVSVAASAKGPSRSNRTHLAHLHEPGSGFMLVLCNRVKTTSILRDEATYTEDRPTCPVCAKSFDLLRQSGHISE